MLTKCKVTISTDVVFEPSYMLMQPEPAQWVVYFSRQTEREHNYGIPFERCYLFTTKPTRRQIRKARRDFKVKYDMYENYN